MAVSRDFVRFADPDEPAARAARAPSIALQVAGLFLAGLLIGVGLQQAGLLPGDARAGLASIAARALGLPRTPARPYAEATPVLPAARAEPAATAAPLVGDADATRNGLRREVIVAARESLAAPCDLDRRAAFQIALRDYARAWASAPRAVGERQGFRTPLDGEAARAAASAARAGLIDPALVQRWRALEQTGVAEMLARERAQIAEDGPAGCPTARRA
jgi:hypothetical protein